MNARPTPQYRSRAVAVALSAAAVVALTATAAGAADQATPDWPCIWRKVENLDASTIWDGPALDTATGWQKDDVARKLSAFVISRRIKLDDAEAAIKKYAESQPAAARDQKLSELFAAALNRTNEERKLMMAGIERFHKRQLARAKEIEKQGADLPTDSPLAKLGAMDPQPAPAGEIGKLTDAEDKYAWDVRVFQERQQNIPIACEIPQLMDERAGAVARAIRGLMKS